MAVNAVSNNSNNLSALFSSQSSVSAQLSGTVTGNDGSTLSFNLQYQASDAVVVALAGDGGSGESPGAVERPHYRRHGGGRRNFAAIDTDGDGLLSKAELQTAQQQRQSAGYKTPLIDRALASYDSLTANGQPGISFDQFARHRSVSTSVPPAGPNPGSSEHSA